jgi:hypothetical protein
MKEYFAYLVTAYQARTQPTRSLCATVQRRPAGTGSDAFSVYAELKMPLFASLS